MVAAKSPVRNQDWPVLGKPSQPVKGSFSQRSRSDSFANLQRLSWPDGHGIILRAN